MGQASTARFAYRFRTNVHCMWRTIPRRRSTHGTTSSGAMRLISYRSMFSGFLTPKILWLLSLLEEREVVRYVGAESGVEFARLLT